LLRGGDCRHQHNLGSRQCKSRSNLSLHEKSFRGAEARKVGATIDRAKSPAVPQMNA
jgi:hypothetical protein